MYSKDFEDIKPEQLAKASMVLGRMSPSDKYLPIAIEIATLAPYFCSKPPKGLGPMSYHTLSYEGDMKHYNRLKEIVDKYGV
jgi:hypothetical protein